MVKQVKLEWAKLSKSSSNFIVTKIPAKAETFGKLDFRVSILYSEQSHLTFPLTGLLLPVLRFYHFTILN